MKIKNLRHVIVYSMIAIMSMLILLPSVKSQTSQTPWTFGAAWHWTDFQGVEYKMRDQLTHAHWIGEAWPSKFSAGRYIIPSFNIEVSFAFQKFTNDYLIFKDNPDPSLRDDLLLTKKFFWNADFEVQYSLANGYMFRETSFFTPYLFGGVGATQINGEPNLMLDYGIAFEFWFSKNIGINFEAAYDYLPNFGHDYLHFSAGIKTRFGKTKDSDKDGIPDKKDICPFTPGLPEFDGCPDTDGDGLIDSLDMCPKIKGSIAMKGCPDADEDGIMDKDDECPKEKGPLALNGCPDRDGDGVADKNDRCPDVPGKKELNGCPDKDEDGIADIDDECIDEPGPVSTKGCPDRDNDGVPDKNDECPNTPGPVALNGCPDTDGDGVPDFKDKCPNEKGVATNFGCPLIDTVQVVKIEEQIRFEAQRIQFETASYVIKPVSYPNLNRIVEIMNKYSGSRFMIEGHTDSVGKDDYNMDLSQNRALSVKQYFIDRGIESERLDSEGYGESRPIDTNATPDGRAKNRRVEIHLIQK